MGILGLRNDSADQCWLGTTQRNWLLGGALINAGVSLLALILTVAATAQEAGTPVSANRLRNGSFEGSLLYWHGIQPEFHRLVRDAAPVGEYTLHIERHSIISAPIVCERGQPFTVSFFVKGDRPGQVHVQMPPSAREEGQRAKRLWVAEGTQSQPIGTTWQRVSFTAMADVPPSGFWPLPHYMVQIGGTVPIQIDGVTVTVGNEKQQAGQDQYLPRAAVEVTVECPDLPGYDPAGNLLPADTNAVRLTGHLANPTATDQEIVASWQWRDYEGAATIGTPVEETIVVPAGKTVHKTITLPRSAKGCLLACVAAVQQGNVLDESRLPITTLPYPMPPGPPDLRERFGGSYFGPKSATLGSQIGLRWSRWYPHTKWHDHQPDGPDSWHWFDADLDLLEGLGVSAHLVLYGWPKWIMDEAHPLPRDMRWGPDDPRWEDLSLQTAWDRYLKRVAEHYRNRAVIYELENEPELDRWEGRETEYAKFTRRSARLIKQVNPRAKVMVNNVYGIPSGLNRRFLELGYAKDIDIISWHDYHSGGLTDATAIQRMRAALDQLGGSHIEIWFNEGWGFTNTAVDEPIACTHLTSAQSTNQMLASVAEMTVAGQAKTVLFHTGYEQHGMSFWDYSGPGTMLWDWYSYPMPLVAGWNTLAHHIGLSEPVGLVRPRNANCCIFQDLRNGRGVIIAYADQTAKADVTIELPIAGLLAEDLMGNPQPLQGQTLTLSRTGRPVVLYDTAKTTGQQFYERMEPLDRKYESFVRAGGAEFQLPPTWQGEANGQVAGNPARADGQPIWRLDQIWPPDPTKPENYRRLVWQDGWWVAPANGHGGQPKVELRTEGLRLEFRAPHSSVPGEKLAGLVFTPPKPGDYRLSGAVTMRLWDGNNPVRLTFLKKSPQQITTVHTLPLPMQNVAVPLPELVIPLADQEELVLLPRLDGLFTGGDITLQDLRLALAIDSLTSWTLPLSWDGTTLGAATGNPVTANGQPVWRLDQIYPDDPTIASHYNPLVWLGGRWGAKEHTHAGQPSAAVEAGVLQLGTMGAWRGPDVEHQKIAGLAFIAPQSGTYRLRLQAASKPWEGQAPHYRLGIFKRDTQRAILLHTALLPRDGSPQTVEQNVELTVGHELIIVPLMPDWHQATATTLANVQVDLLATAN